MKNVSVYLATLLQKHGFQEPCLNKYNSKSNTVELCPQESDRLCYFNIEDLKENDLLVPTLEEANKWLRVSHHIFVSIYPKIGVSGQRGFKSRKYVLNPLGNAYQYNDVILFGENYEEVLEKSLRDICKNLSTDKSVLIKNTSDIVIAILSQVSGNSINYVNIKRNENISELAFSTLDWIDIQLFLEKRFELKIPSEVLKEMISSKTITDLCLVFCDFLIHNKYDQ